jgi:hypothetical protein
MANAIAEKLRDNYVSYCTRRALTLRAEVADLWARVCASSLDEWLYDGDGSDPISARLPLDVTGAVARLLAKHYKHPRPDAALRCEVATLLVRALAEAHFAGRAGGVWSIGIETCDERLCLFSVYCRFAK